MSNGLWNKKSKFITQTPRFSRRLFTLFIGAKRKTRLHTNLSAISQTSNLFTPTFRLFNQKLRFRSERLKPFSLIRFTFQKHVFKPQVCDNKLSLVTRKLSACLLSRTKSFTYNVFTVVFLILEEKVVFIQPYRGKEEIGIQQDCGITLITDSLECVGLHSRRGLSSSSRHGATKLKPRNSSCAFALGGMPGESERTKINSVISFCSYQGA